VTTTLQSAIRRVAKTVGTTWAPLTPLVYGSGLVRVKVAKEVPAPIYAAVSTLIILVVLHLLVFPLVEQIKRVAR
jgi:hypothetical protein